MTTFSPLRALPDGNWPPERNRGRTDSSLRLARQRPSALPRRGGRPGVALAACLLLLGCRDAPLELGLGSCASLAARLNACGLSEAAPRTVERRCSQYPTDFADHVDCAFYDHDCAGFRACFERAVARVDPRRRARRLGHYLEDIRAALAAQDFTEARGLCEELGADPELDPEARARCGQVSARAVEVMLPRVQRLRDGALSAQPSAAGFDVSGLEACHELVVWAGRVSPEKLAEARQTCDEAAVALAVAPVLAADRPLAQRPALGCDAAIAQAVALGTPFGATLQEALVRSCGLDSAVALMASGPGCDHRLRRALEVMEASPKPWADEAVRVIDKVRGRCGS